MTDRDTTPSEHLLQAQALERRVAELKAELDTLKRKREEHTKEPVAGPPPPRRVRSPLAPAPPVPPAPEPTSAWPAPPATEYKEGMPLSQYMKNRLAHQAKKEAQAKKDKETRRLLSSLTLGDIFSAFSTPK